MKNRARWILIVMFGLLTASHMIGCEVDADADDDGGSVEVEVGE